MSRIIKRGLSFLAVAFFTFLLAGFGSVWAQNSKVLGEVQFAPASKVERQSGVWIDGQYVGYMKELKWTNRIRLIPGSHEISVRQVGFTDFTKVVVVEPGGLVKLPVRMTPDTKAQYPGSDAAKLRLDIKPKRAAVFVDDGYVGNAGHFGGANIMVVSPGSHRIRVELPGYRSFETDINLAPHQTSKVETNLLAGSVQQSGALIKQQ